MRFDFNLLHSYLLKSNQLNPNLSNFPAPTNHWSQQSNNQNNTKLTSRSRVYEPLTIHRKILPIMAQPNGRRDRSTFDISFVKLRKPFNTTVRSFYCCNFECSLPFVACTVFLHIHPYKYNHTRSFVRVRTGFPTCCCAKTECTWKCNCKLSFQLLLPATNRSYLQFCTNNNLTI